MSGSRNGMVGIRRGRGENSRGRWWSLLFRVVNAGSVIRLNNTDGTGIIFV